MPVSHLEAARHQPQQPPVNSLQAPVYYGNFTVNTLISGPVQNVQNYHVNAAQPPTNVAQPPTNDAQPPSWFKPFTAARPDRRDQQTLIDRPPVKIKKSWPTQDEDGTWRHHIEFEEDPRMGVRFHNRESAKRQRTGNHTSSATLEQSARGGEVPQNDVLFVTTEGWEAARPVVNRTAEEQASLSLGTQPAAAAVLAGNAPQIDPQLTTAKPVGLAALSHVEGKEEEQASPFPDTQPATAAILAENTPHINPRLTTANSAGMHRFLHVAGRVEEQASRLESQPAVEEAVVKESTRPEYVAEPDQAPSFFTTEMNAEAMTELFGVRIEEQQASPDVGSQPAGAEV